MIHNQTPAPAPIATNLKQAPQVPGVPFFGNLFKFQNDRLGTLQAWWQQYGDAYRMKLGPFHIFVTSSPEIAEQILLHDRPGYTKVESLPSRQPRGLKLFLGDGLLTNVDHDSWLSQRRMMQPMFHRKRITDMGDKMVAAGEDMLARWDGKTEIELNQEMMTVTMDIITRTMFSADVLGQAGKAGHAVTVGIDFITSRLNSPIEIPLEVPTPRNRAFLQARADIDDLIYGFINARRASGDKPGDLLDMLMDARDEDTGESMTDEQIRDEATTIFGAGHETTANALTWTWWYLAQYPHVLEQLQAEVDSVLNGRTPTMDDLPNLPYTLQVMEESMRLMPPVAFIPRVTKGERALGDYWLPEPTVVFIAIANIHRHPDYWTDPDTFDPSRFAPERKKTEQRHRMAYMPFGGGPRLCIGTHFALMEGQLLLAMMAQRYSMDIAPGQTIKPHVAITTRPENGLHMMLTRR